MITKFTQTDDASVISVNTSAGKTFQFSEAQTEEIPELIPLERLLKITKEEEEQKKKNGQ